MNVVLCARGALAAVALAAAALLANTPPVVSAGPDTSTRLGRQFRLQGSVSDDGIGGGSLVVRWTQVSGPAGGASIAVEDAPRSLVDFAATGEYRFRLWASDGVLETQDTVTVAVMDSIRFEVLSPRAADTLVRGATCQISWQVDPPGTNVIVGYSIDDGDSFVAITPNRTTVTSLAWQVPAGLPPGGRVIIRVTDYFTQGRYTQSAPLVISTAPASVHHARAGRQSTARVMAGGVLQVEGADATSRLEIRDLNGRAVWQGDASSARLPARSRVFVYLLRNGATVTSSGSLLSRDQP